MTRLTPQERGQASRLTRKHEAAHAGSVDSLHRRVPSSASIFETTQFSIRNGVRSQPPDVRSHTDNYHPNSIDNVALKTTGDPATERAVTTAAMRTDSADGRVIASHPTVDSVRAITPEHQKTDSTDSRVLARHETNDNLRAVAPLHQKDNSTDSRVLASDPYVGENSPGVDANRAVGNSHTKTNAQDSRTISDNTVTTSYNADGTVRRSHNTSNSVANSHIKNVRAEKVEGELLVGNVPNLGIGAKTTGTLAAERLGVHGNGRHSENYAPTPHGAGDHNSTVSSNPHGSGDHNSSVAVNPHGNGTHLNPGYSEIGHSHGGSVSTSLRFMVMPRSARDRALAARETVSEALTAGDYDDRPELQALAKLVLAGTHTIWDGLTETAAEREERLGDYEELPEELDATLWEMYSTEVDFSTTKPMDASPEYVKLRHHDDPDISAVPVGWHSEKPRFVAEPHPDLA